MPLKDVPYFMMTESGEDGAAHLTGLDVDINPGHPDYMPPALKLRWRVRRVVENLYVRLFSLVLVLVDVILFFVRLSEVDWDFDSDKDPSVGYDVASIIIICYFLVELALRIYGKGPRAFFSNWLDVFDFFVIVLSAIFTFAFEIGRVLILARLVRLLIIFRIINEQKQLFSSTRLLVKTGMSDDNPWGVDYQQPLLQLFPFIARNF
eukprot:m.124907 g.124907  ORF g.124907 m.124907 type:complete len:207 (+) comp16637_c0_seq5:136-756(+)